jgi:hypothetical protein
LDPKVWLGRHETELPQMNAGECLLGDNGRKGPKLVFGGEEDRHTGELGIRKRKYDRYVGNGGKNKRGADEDARTTVPVHRKGYALELWREVAEDRWDELDEERILARIAVLERRLANYDDEKQTAEGKRRLRDELESEKYWHQILWRKTAPEQQEQARHYWLGFCGFENPRVAIKEYQYAVLRASRLTKLQLSTVLMRAQNATQAEIAARSKTTQQAVSKTLRAGTGKIADVRRKLGGPHKGLTFEMIHWADTHGLSDWGKHILEETGRFATNCRRCPSVIGRKI